VGLVEVDFLFGATYHVSSIGYDNFEELLAEQMKWMNILNH
jgi:hypothetical protein